MTIVEYRLDPQSNDSYPRTIPDYISDGGYWVNPDNRKMIAMIPDSDVPDGATTYTLEELQARQRAVHVKYPIKVVPYPTADDMTVDEVNNAVKEWVDARS